MHDHITDLTGRFEGLDTPLMPCVGSHSHYKGNLGSLMGIMKVISFWMCGGIWFRENVAFGGGVSSFFTHRGNYIT